MGFFEDFCGGVKQRHGDGSVTNRFSKNSSVATVTRNRDGSVRERVTREWGPLGFGQRTVTRNGKGKMLNEQPGWRRR